MNINYYLIGPNFEFSDNVTSYNAIILSSLPTKSNTNEF